MDDQHENENQKGDKDEIDWKNFDFHQEFSLIGQQGVARACVLALGELISSEILYVKRLQTIMDFYVTPLAQVFSPEDTIRLFGNIESIFHLNRNLLIELIKILQKSIKASVPAEKVCIGKCFGQNMPSLYPQYAKYCAGYGPMMTLLSELAGTPVSGMSSVLSKHSIKLIPIESDANDLIHQTLDFQLDAMPLSSLLIMPVSRMPRYMLLIKTLVKTTGDTHPDFFNLKRALEEIQKGILKINDTVRKSEMERT